MTRNYVDIPILVLKRIACASAVTPGHLLKGGATGGFANSDANTTTLGGYVLTYDSATTYASVMFLGTFRGSANDSIHAGEPVIWADTAGKVDSCPDSVYRAFGTCIDGSAAATTRATRVLITGMGTPCNTWDTI